MVIDAGRMGWAAMEAGGWGVNRGENSEVSVGTVFVAQIGECRGCRDAGSSQARVYEQVGQGVQRAVVAVAYYVATVAALAPLLPLRRQSPVAVVALATLLGFLC